MVHALQQVHSLLRPGGVLVDVHGLSVPPLIEIHSPGAVSMVGWLTHASSFASELAAFNTLAKVVAEGHFRLEDEQDIDFFVYTDDLKEFKEYLAEWWESAILAEGTMRRIEDLYREVGPDARIVLNERARMIKLSAV